MNTRFSKILQYIILLSLGILLCWKFFETLNLHDLMGKISSGDFGWFYLVMIVSLLVYVLRVLRWLMLIKAIGHEATFHSAFSALSISYMVSFVVPRLGDVTRCLSVKKQSNIPFIPLLGTVIIERVIDIISLLIVLLVTLILQFHEIIEFMQAYVFKPFYEGVILKVIGGNTFFLVAGVASIALLVFLFYYFRKYIRERSPKRIVSFIESLKQGIASVLKLENKKIFIVYTILIWLGYYLMTYFWFFVFKETAVLTWGACLSILTIGTIGRSVPIQGGGMGAYHFLVMSVVMLYGLSSDWGKALATLIHAGQTFFTFAMGLIGLLIFFVDYWRKK